MSILKSDNDYRNYDNFILDNGLEVVLIEDKKATLSAVSLCVNCGSYDDEIQGSAHFLEHMLFMGNEKYPDEKYYSFFINSHNGFSNAYTAGDHTNYYYNIDSNYLLESFDVFSNFFISPLFDESCLEREMNAVDSEHKKNLQDDNWRNFQMIKNICSDKSPLSKFSTGNLTTLNIPNIRDKIINFFNKYYSSNIMKLVVLYNGENINKIKEEIKIKFGQIKNKNVSIDRNRTGHLNTNKLIKIVPIKDSDEFVIVFELELTDKAKNNNLLKYISYLITHEGEGTLTNYLLKNIKINEMYVSEECVIGNYCIYTIRFILNETTDELFNYLLDGFKKYINILIETTNDKKMIDLLKEDRFLNNQSFDNFEIDDEADYVSLLCSNLIEYNIDRKYLLKYNYIIGDLLTTKEITEELFNLLNCLNFNNSNFSLLSTSNKYNNNSSFKEEYYYKIKYIEEELKNFQIKKSFNGLLKFPNLNQNIIKNKEFIKNKVYDLPKNVYNLNNISAYLKINTNLNSKNCELFIKVMKNDIYMTPENYISYMFYIQYFDLLFLGDMFDLISANNKVSLLLNSTNYLLHVSAYYSNLDNILLSIIESLNKVNDYILNNKHFFQIFKDKLMKTLKNKKLDPPYRQVYMYEKDIINTKNYNTEVLEKVLKNFNSVEDLKPCNFFSYNKIIVYCEGNINKDKFEEIKKIFTDNFIYINEKQEDINLNLDIVNKVIKKEYYIENKDEENECTGINIFIGNLFGTNWAFEYASTYIFDNIVSREFFDRLRTKEQLGYIVKASKNIIGKTNKQYFAYEFLVQSNKKDAEYLEKRIITFISDEIKDIINNIDTEYLKDIQSTIKEGLLKDFNNIEDSSIYYYDKIINNNFAYNFNKIVAAEIYNVSKESLILFYKKHFDLNKYLSIKIKKLNI